MSASAVEATGVRESVSRGLRWKALSQAVSLVLRTTVGIALARLLTPKEFGVAAMALAFTGIAAIFTELSMGAALIQRPTITEEDRSTVFWTTLASGLAMTAIGVALAPLAGRFFSNSAVTPLFAATATLALLSALSITQTALLTRAMDFRSLEIRAIVSSFIGAGAAIGMAFAGFGAWVIVGQSLITTGISSVLVWRLSPWRPRWIYSRDSLRVLGAFGVKTQASRVLSYLNLFADNILIGRYLGSGALGVYSIAYNVMFQPMTALIAPLQQVMYPAFARLQGDPPRQAQAFLRSNRLAAALTVPAFLGIAVIAPDFVPVILGGRWHKSVPVLELLSLAGVAQSLQTLNWSVLQAKGKPGTTLRIMIFTSIVTLSAFAFGLIWGVVGVAGLFAVARFVALLVNTTVTCRSLDFSLATYVRGMSGVTLLSVVMAAAVYGGRILLDHAGLAPALRLVVLVPAGGAIYAVLLLWQARDIFVELRGLVGRRR